MKGREPKKVYVYNELGEFVREFETSADFAEHYNYARNIMSIHRNRIDSEIFMINENEFASNKRVGKQRIRNYVNKYNSPYVRKNKPYKEERVVDCYNLEGELIASFKDEFYLKALIGRPIVISKDEFFHNTDLKFKYSDQERPEKTVLEKTDIDYITELKVFEIARLEKGVWEELVCDFPIEDVLVSCPTSEHTLTGVVYSISGSKVFVSSRIPTKDHIFVTCKLQVPSSKIMENFKTKINEF